MTSHSTRSRGWARRLVAEDARPAQLPAAALVAVLAACSAPSTRACHRALAKTSAALRGSRTGGESRPTAPPSSTAPAAHERASKPNSTSATRRRRRLDGATAVTRSAADDRRQRAAPVVVRCATAPSSQGQNSGEAPGGCRRYRRCIRAQPASQRGVLSEAGAGRLQHPGADREKDAAYASCKADLYRARGLAVPDDVAAARARRICAPPVRFDSRVFFFFFF